jgi:hypothetical protein
MQIKLRLFGRYKHSGHLAITYLLTRSKLMMKWLVLGFAALSLSISILASQNSLACTMAARMTL